MTKYYPPHGGTSDVVYQGDYASLQAALTAAGTLAASRATPVKVKSTLGVQTVTASIHTPSDTILDLTGTTLRLPNNDSLPSNIFVMDGVNNVEVFGATLDGNESNQPVWNEFSHSVLILSST